VHTTFQYSGAVGKLHRLREAQLWLDEPSYYRPNGGVLAYTPTMRRELARPSCDDGRWRGPGPCMHVEPHFTLVHEQLVQATAAQFGAQFGAPFGATRRASRRAIRRNSH